MTTQGSFDSLLGKRQRKEGLVETKGGRFNRARVGGKEW